MLKVGVASVSAFLEPSTTAGAATGFAGLLDDAALSAYTTHRFCPLEACIRQQNGGTDTKFDASMEIEVVRDN